jgi:hypothetical protein
MKQARGIFGTVRLLLHSLLMGFLPNDESRRRARARGSWNVVRRSLHEDDYEDLSRITTAEERLEMMWPLAVSAWSLSGVAIPGYSRAQAPGRLLRGHRR